MKISFFDTHNFEKNRFVELSKTTKLEFVFLDMRLDSTSASLAAGSKAVCSFVNDKIDAKCIEILKSQGVELILLRSAGYNHVDVKAACQAGMTVARVPSYSPNAVAEFAVALLLTLNRKTHRAYNRVREHNFSLDGLVGFDLNKKTVGVLGAGKIGKIFAQIMAAFGCRVLIYDLVKDAELVADSRMRYTNLDEMCLSADVISLHMPLNPQTFHLINHDLMAKMKKGVLLINTGRGALVDASALVSALKTGKLGGAALDVYEEEDGIFFHDLSNTILKDETLARLLTFPNVLITSHQAFLTEEALRNIAETTIESANDYFDQKKIASEKLVLAQP
jgi:D-lactate dehydrogenase